MRILQIVLKYKKINTQQIGCFIHFTILFSYIYIGDIMSKKDDFKEFASKNPSLAKYIENGEMSWQKFYELYDIYGEDESVWSKYKNSERNGDSSFKINDLIKGVNIDTIKEHISTAQKALDFVQELTSKTGGNVPKAPVTPRPLNKFFED